MSETELLAKSLEAGERSGMWYPSMEASAELRRLSAELAALKTATFTVLEGFTLPHDVRKILESAIYTIPKDKP